MAYQSPRPTSLQYPRYTSGIRIRFIPKTSRNEHHKSQMTELKDLNSLERWFAERMVMGNRNNQMIKYALALFDAKMLYPEIESRVIEFNKKIDNPLSDNELQHYNLKNSCT